jgi:hypothetical protein
MDSFSYGPRRGLLRRHRVVAAVLGFVLALGGGALAAVLINGSGFGRAHSGIWTTIQIVPDDTAVTGDLIPTANRGLAFSVHNTFGGPITIQSIGGGPSPLVRFAATPAGSGSDASACQITLNEGTLSTAVVGATLAGGATRFWNVDSAVSMGSTPADSCQAQSFDVSLMLTATPGP